MCNSHSKRKFSGDEWTQKDISSIWDILSKHSKDKYGLDFYDPLFEIVTEEGMIDVSCTHALPNLYRHWSFGKRFVKQLDDYLKGKSGTIFEMIINSNPAVCYLMYSNNLSAMIDVIAHAAIGHSSFFKNNYLFKQWTDADSVLPFCNYAREFITQCELKHGVEPVEHLLDLLHSVSNISYFKNKKIHFSNIYPENVKIDPTVQTLSNFFFVDKKTDEEVHEPYDVSDNILEIILNYGDLPEWKQEIIKIFMYINQYFYPQIQTKMMNEGWATFWQCQLLDDLHEMKIVNDQIMFEHLHIKSSVVYQVKQSFLDPLSGRKHMNDHYSQINPYTFGLEMFREIKRVCLEQDEESLRAVPSLRGADWVEAVKYAMANFRDDSFIAQYLTPHLCRKLKFANISAEMLDKDIFDRQRVRYTYELTHDDIDFDELREKISRHYHISSYYPEIKTYVLLQDNENSWENRRIPKLILAFTPLREGQRLYNDYKKKVLKNIENLWLGPVIFCMSSDIDRYI